MHRTVYVLSLNAPAVSEPAKTYLLKYYSSRNQAA